MYRPTAWLTLFIALVLAAACDKVPLLAPTQSTISLSINTTTLPINGTAEVIATVTEQPGTPVQNGTQVTFSATLGVMDPVNAFTEGGLARSTFRAGTQSGTAKINAASGSARTTGDGEISVLVGSAAVTQIAVRTDPTTVPQAGGTVQVMALVLDVSGNPMPGVVVAFSTTNGSLGATQVQTNLVGEARTTLNTNRDSVVTARVAALTATANVTVIIVSNPTVTVTGPTTTQNVNQPITFTVTPTVVANTGSPVRQVTVDFGDGSAVQQLGPITSATPVVHTYSQEGNYTVRAVVTDTAGLTGQGSTSVSIGRALPTATITASPTTVTAGDPVQFTVSSAPGAGGPPVLRVDITFSDGQGNTSVPPSASFTRSFTTAGTHIITATAIDTAGTRGIPSQTSILVRPRAALEVNVDAASADSNFTVNCLPQGNTYPKTCTVTGGLFTPVGANPRVNLQATVVGLPAGDAILNYHWNFDDGTQADTATRGTDHVFARNALAPRTYVVTVVVTTANGSTGNGRITLTVQ